MGTGFFLGCWKCFKTGWWWWSHNFVNMLKSNGRMLWKGESMVCKLYINKAVTNMVAYFLRFPGLFPLCVLSVPSLFFFFLFSVSWSSSFLSVWVPVLDVSPGVSVSRVYTLRLCCRHFCSLTSWNREKRVVSAAMLPWAGHNWHEYLLAALQTCSLARQSSRCFALCLSSEMPRFWKSCMWFLPKSLLFLDSRGYFLI